MLESGMVETEAKKIPLTCLYGGHGSGSWENLFALDTAVLEAFSSGSQNILVALEAADLAIEISDKIYTDTQGGSSPLLATYKQLGLGKEGLERLISTVLISQVDTYKHCELEILEELNSVMPGKLALLYEGQENVPEVRDFCNWLSDVELLYQDAAEDGDFEAGLVLFMNYLYQDAEFHRMREEFANRRIEEKVLTDRMDSAIVLFGTLHTSFSDRCNRDLFEVRRKYTDGLPVYYSPADALERVLIRKPETSLFKTDWYRAFLGAVYFDFLPETEDPKTLNAFSLEATKFARSFRGMKDIGKFKKMVRELGWDDAVAAWGF